MGIGYWYTLAGLLLLATALLVSRIKLLPLTVTMLYLLVGIGLGPLGAGFLNMDPLRYSTLLEYIAELAVIVSLFIAGLKMRVPLTQAIWAPPVRLAFVSMSITVGLITAVGYYLLKLPLGGAVLLGAILAPTDPVLASDVQIAHPKKRDRLRFSLTAEAGLNDGTAFPFVMLGLGLLGLHELGELGWRWLVVDVLWAIPGGLAVGALTGTLLGRLVVRLRSQHKAEISRNEFIALGLLALAYGLALLIFTYGFLAAFAAGVAIRRVERHHPARGKEKEELQQEVHAQGREEELASSEEGAPAYMAETILHFNEQLERLLELLVVLLMGSLVTAGLFQGEAWRSWWFVPVLLLLIRPLAVSVGLARAKMPRLHRGLICWFGIRGIGSIYYLMYAINHGLPEDLGRTLMFFTLMTIITSIAIHGVTVTPLMRWYERVGEKE